MAAFRRAKYFLQEKWNRHRFPIVAALFFATMVAAVVGFGYLAYLEVSIFFKKKKKGLELDKKRRFERKKNTKVLSPFPWFVVNM